MHRHDGEQRRTGLHALAELDLALGDDAIERRADDRAFEIDGRLIAARAGEGDFRVGLFG